MATIQELITAAGTDTENLPNNCLRFTKPVLAVHGHNSVQKRVVRVTLVDLDGKHPGTAHAKELKGWHPVHEFRILKIIPCIEKGE